MTDQSHEACVVLEIDAETSPPTVVRACVISSSLISQTQYLGGPKIMAVAKGAVVRAPTYGEAYRMAIEGVAFFPWIIDLLGPGAKGIADAYRADLEKKVYPERSGT